VRAFRLSRTPDLILKADLDVSLSHAGKEPVTVLGECQPPGRFYLRDLSDLKAGKLSSPSRRPPYFSIEQEPLGDWRLKLNVTGDKFLKVRSPLFNGVVSTSLRLSGTLNEPLSVGEVTVNSGEGPAFLSHDAGDSRPGCRSRARIHISPSSPLRGVQDLWL